MDSTILDAGLQIDGMLSEVAIGDAWAVGPGLR